MTPTVSRRGFVGGVAAAVAGLTLPPDREWGLARAPRPTALQQAGDHYDTLAKLANNENPYGPSESVLEAMTRAFKYANRYGYPDGDITEEIARHHGVKPEQIMLGAGSSEILDVACSALLQDDRKVVGSDPSYDMLYQHATGLKADQIKVPLLGDYRQDIPGLIRAVKARHRDVGFLYLCNPNNPTGGIVAKQEVARLIEEIPEDVPVVIDEAYHHFVVDPAYATAVPYVLEGRPVIVTRTFSKIFGLAGMRLGYAVSSRDLIQRLRPYAATLSINAIVKWAGVAALRDTASEARVKRTTLDLRDRTTAELEALGYPVIPSQANFFMVHLRRPVQPVIQEFRKRGVLVGRPFPPLLEHLRVSVGTADEMRRFMTAFKEILPGVRANSGER